MREGDFELPEYVRLGDIFQDRYRLETVLGRGAVGVVVGAQHLLLDRPVAIKFMLGASSEQPDSVARFVQEARSAARLKSANVVRIFDVAVLDNGVPYIVMERLEGTDLAALLRRSGPVGVQRGVQYVLEACEAISEAHDAGIVHRDLKPANLFLVERPGMQPAIKVLDFGIAKSSPTLAPTTLDLSQGDVVVRMTLPRSIMGSPLYMSPEQMESSGDVDSRTDIWALGVTLFELVTGNVPFAGTTIVQVYSQMLGKEAKWLDKLPADAPPYLARAIEKCLRRDRTERHASVRELARALAPLVVPPPLEHTQPSPSPSFAAGPIPRVRPPRRRATPVIAGLALATAVAMAWVLSQRRPMDRASAETASPQMVRAEVAAEPRRAPAPSGDVQAARTPPVEALDPIPMRVPAGPRPPPAGSAVGPSVSALSQGGHTDSGAHAVAIPRAPAAPVPPTDGSSLPAFNVDDMLRRRE
jgi:serine/threonine-protein kinase